MRSRVSQWAAMSFGVVLVAVLGFLMFGRQPASLSASAGAPGAVPAAGSPCQPRLHLPVQKYVGVAPAAPWQASVEKFASASGQVPSIVESYQRFGTPFDAARACQVERMAALPLIQVLPRYQSFTKISGGSYDQYLASYALAVRKFRATVVLSFAHEMNGPWFSWSQPHVTAQQFVAAWRHIHDVFAREGASNVIWLWNINRVKPQVYSPVPYWPGSKYVNWVGIDAYYNDPGDTFQTVFSPTVSVIRRVTGDPILIAETAVSRRPQSYAQVKNLIQGVRRGPGILGFVWFDMNRREAWHLEADPGGLAAFHDYAGSQARESLLSR